MRNNTIVRNNKKRTEKNPTTIGTTFKEQKEIRNKNEAAVPRPTSAKKKVRTAVQVMEPEQCPQQPISQQQQQQQQQQQPKQPQQQQPKTQRFHAVTTTNNTWANNNHIYNDHDTPKHDNHLAATTPTTSCSETANSVQQPQLLSTPNQEQRQFWVNSNYNHNTITQQANITNNN